MLKGVFAVVLFAGGFAAVSSGLPWLRTTLDRATTSTAEVEAIMDRSLGEMSAVLKSDFPEDHLKLVEDITTIIRTTGPGENAQGKVAELTVALRKKYAAHIRNASDLTLRRLSVSTEHMHRTVLNTYGFAVCNDFAIRGGMALIAQVKKDPTVIESLDEFGSMLFKAIAEGMKSSASVEPPSEADWIALSDFMVERGVSDRHLELMSGEEPNDAEYCPALISMMSAVSEFNGEAGHRIRAEIAAVSAGS